MRLCVLCGLITNNEADFAITYGEHDCLLHVCRWCMQDLTLLGFNAYKVARLQEPSEKLILGNLERYWSLGSVKRVEAEEERATLRWVQLIENALEGDVDNG